MQLSERELYEDALVTLGYTQYVPAEDQTSWTLICGRSFIAGLAAGAPANVLDELWRLGRQASARIESVVGAIPLTGEGGVRSFAIVSLPADVSGTDGCTVTAVVRGTACVDVVSVGGARRFSAAGVQPWVLADFRSVTGFVMGAENAPAALTARATGASFPLGEGVVRTARAFWTQNEPEKELAAIGLGRQTDIVELERTVVFRRGSIALTPESSEHDVDLDETIIRGRVGAIDSSAVDSPAVGSSAVDVTSVDPTAADEDTILRDERPAATPTPVATQPSVPAQAPRSTPPRVTRPGPAPATPAVAIAPATPRAAEPCRFGFRIVPGDSYELDAPTFFGRSPRTPAIASGVTPRLVTVSSPTQEVSSTHVRIEQSGDSVVVTDLRSTNGTVVSGPGIPSTRLRPGESRVVLPGTTVDIGDGNIIEIVSPRHEK